MLWKYAVEAQPVESPVLGSGSTRPGIRAAGCIRTHSAARCTRRGAEGQIGGKCIPCVPAVGEAETAEQAPATGAAAAAAVIADDGARRRSEEAAVGDQHTDPGEDILLDGSRTHFEAGKPTCEEAGNHWSSAEKHSEDRWNNHGLQEVEGSVVHSHQKDALRSWAAVKQTSG